MKRLLILMVLLMPFIVKAQTLNLCGPYSIHAPISLSNASNQTISGDTINGKGANTILISLTNCHDIHITKNWIGNSANVCINLLNCYNITIDSNHVERGISIIHAVNCANGGIVIKNNQLLDPIGPVSSGGNGQFVQFNNVNTTTVQNIVQNNLMQRDFNVGRPEDCVSLYQSNGTSSLPILVDHNYILGNGGSNTSTTGGGIMTGDSGGSWEVVSNNILVNPGQYGIAISQGDHISLINNTVFASQAPFTNVGLYVWTQQGNSPSPPAKISNATVSGNHVKWTNSAGADNGVWLASGENTPSGWNTNNFSDGSLNTSLLNNPLWTNCSVTVTPPSIAYSPSTQTYTLGVAITPISPTNTGGAAVSYSISPALPTGLSFNGSNGTISGTPTVTSAAKSYSIVATNTGGSGTAPLTITVQPGAIVAPNVSYSPNSYVFAVGANVSINPSNSGGAATSWSISGSIPSGLTFSTSTGAITGTTLATFATTTRTVTATNSGGSATTPITFSVNAAAPIIVYPTPSQTGTYGTAIVTMTPSNSGGVASSWTITPSLPSGLSFNTSSGVISGTPTTVNGLTSYVVRATNATGTGSTGVNLTINTAPLIISVLSMSKSQGLPNPALTYSYNGMLRNGDISIQIPPTISTTATTTSPIGVYPITLTGASSPFYTISLVNGTLSVYNGATIVILGISYGGIH